MQTLFEIILAVIEILNLAAESIETSVFEKFPFQEKLSTTNFDMSPCPIVCRHSDLS